MVYLVDLHLTSAVSTGRYFTLQDDMKAGTARAQLGIGINRRDDLLRPGLNYSCPRVSAVVEVDPGIGTNPSYYPDHDFIARIHWDTNQS